MSVLCHFRTHAPQQKPSFDHFVGGNLQRERNSQAERLRGLEVDHQLEPRGLYHRQICGLRAVENNAVDEAVLDRLIAAGEDDWNRRGRWREALKDGLVGSLRSKAIALND
jgi:hypothetical protein